MGRGEEILEVVETKRRGFKEEVLSSVRSCKEDKIKTEKSWSDCFLGSVGVVREEQQGGTRFPLPHFHLGT